MDDLLTEYCQLFGYASCWYMNRMDAAAPLAIALVILVIALRIMWVSLKWLTRPR